MEEMVEHLILNKCLMLCPYPVLYDQTACKHRMDDGICWQRLILSLCEEKEVMRKNKYE